MNKLNAIETAIAHSVLDVVMDAADYEERQVLLDGIKAIIEGRAADGRIDIQYRGKVDDAIKLARKLGAEIQSFRIWYRGPRETSSSSVTKRENATSFYFLPSTRNTK